MKVFLCSFNNKIKIEAALKLRERGVEIIYWLGQKKIFESYADRKEDFPGIVFHNTLEAVRAIPAPGIDTSKFESPSAVFIQEMLTCESQTLSMMNSIDFHNTVLDKRKRIYYEYLKYWYGVLVNLKPDAIIFGDVPHIPHNYVIFCLAKRLGIKTVISTDVKRLPDRMIFLKDFTKYEELKEAYQKLQQSRIQLEDLSPELKDYYLKEADPTIVSTSIVTNRYLETINKSSRVFPSLYILIKNIKNFSLLKTSLKYLKQLSNKKTLASIEDLSHETHLSLRMKLNKWNRINKEYRREYESLQVPVDFTKKYIYVPLHSQPERSTAPEGGVFMDQILMIDMLSSVLPEDWVIYIKEHQVQWLMYRGFVGRYKDYYKDIINHKNVYLIPVDTSTFKLIKNSQAVASVTGTASWEAVVRGKPTLLFGNIFFMHCNGVLRVSSVNECRAAIEKICDGYKPESQQVITFLKAVDDICIRAHDHHKNNKFSEISDEENIQRFMEGYWNVLIA